MGLFDLFNSTGALSETQNIPSPYMQVTQDGNTSTQMNPAYTQYVNEQTNPKNMNTGMKLMLLGQALQGQDVSGSIVDYQKGIRDRFRQRAMDQRQLGLDDLNRSQTELNMANTQQNMDFAKQKQPLAMDQLSLQNQSTNLANQASRQTYGQNQIMNPLLVEQQRLNNANQETTNAAADLRFQQAKTNDARWVGNHEEGVVMRMNPTTGIDEDVTSQYTDAQIAAFKAANKPAASKTKLMHPTLDRPLSDGELQRDKTFAKELETFRPEQAMGNIGVLSMISDELSSQQAGDATGLAWSSPLKSAVRILDREGDMGLRALFDDESLDTQQVIAGVIQQNLRQTLGAQFTQREGMLLIDRAYNPTLPPAMNAKRLKALAMLAEATIKARQAKLDHYNKFGTLAGYDPKLEEGLEAMKLQVLQVYEANGGNSVTGSSTPQNGRTSTGTSWSVSPSAP